MRAILQKGRTKPGLVLPAAALEKVNQVSDKRTLEKWLGQGAPGPKNIQVEPASEEKAVLKGGPVPQAPVSLPVEDSQAGGDEKKATGLLGDDGKEATGDDGKDDKQSKKSKKKGKA